jgi:hypothetical protein
MHDPALFPEPDKFYPERWLSLDAPAYPNAAFGSGARRCPGRFFAHATMWLTAVGMLAAFDISPTEDGPPEEIYLSGMVSCAAWYSSAFRIIADGQPIDSCRNVKPFRCYIRPRSGAAALLVQMTENGA